jgi:hypothetical protein
VFFSSSVFLYFQLEDPKLVGSVGAGRGSPVDGTHDGENDDDHGIVVVGIYDEDGDMVSIELDVQEVELATGVDEE